MSCQGLIVLARNRREFDAWRERAGLAPRNAHYLTLIGGKGRRLHHDEVVALPGFWDRRDVGEFARVLAPAGVLLRKIHTVGSAK